MKKNKNYKLIALLSNNGFNQRKLAELLALSYPAVQNRVNGRRPFTDKDIIKIKEQFNLNPDQIDDIFLQR